MSFTIKGYLMSRVLTTTKLIKSVRQRAFVPKEDAVYNDQAIIDILNEQIDTMLLPKLMSINEEYLVVSESITTEADKDRYAIPYRAVGNKLRDVSFRDGGGNYYEMSRISLEEVSDYRWNNASNASDLFYIQNNEVVLVSSRSSDYEFLDMFFYLRPNVIVKNDLCATITSIDTDNGVITLSSFPSAFADEPLFDFIGAKTPNKIFDYDVAVTSVNRSAKTVLFDPALLPSELSVGDYVTVAEESCVPNFPTEYHPLLAQMAAVFILEAMGDTEGLQNAVRKLSTMETGILQMTNDRVEGAPQKVNPRHTTLVDGCTRGRFRGRRRL